MEIRVIERWDVGKSKPESFVSLFDYVALQDKNAALLKLLGEAWPVIEEMKECCESHGYSLTPGELKKLTAIEQARKEGDAKL